MIRTSRSANSGLPGAGRLQCLRFSASKDSAVIEVVKDLLERDEVEMGAAILAV